MGGKPLGLDVPGADGKNVVKVEPGQAQASVVRETSGSNGNNGGTPPQNA